MQPRHPRRNAVECRLVTRLSPLLLLDEVPVGLYLGGGCHVNVTKYMGVSSHQFLTHHLGHVIDVEHAVFTGDDGVEEHLKKHVSKLVLNLCVGHQIGIALVKTRDGVDQLVGLLDQVLDQTPMSLISVPRALDAESSHGAHRTDETCRFRVDEQRGPKSGKRRVDVFGQGLGYRSIRGAQTNQHRHLCLLWGHPVD